MQHCYRLALRREETPTRAREMDRYSRRQVLAGAAAATMLGTPSVRSQTNQQTLRFIAEADLKVLDPIWTTAYITRNHTISSTIPFSELTRTNKSSHRWLNEPAFRQTACDTYSRCATAYGGTTVSRFDRKTALNRSNAGASEIALVNS